MLLNLLSILLVASVAGQNQQPADCTTFGEKETCISNSCDWYVGVSLCQVDGLSQGNWTSCGFKADTCDPIVTCARNPENQQVYRFPSSCRPFGKSASCDGSDACGSSSASTSSGATSSSASTSSEASTSSGESSESSAAFTSSSSGESTESFSSSGALSSNSAASASSDASESSSGSIAESTGVNPEPSSESDPGESWESSSWGWTSQSASFFWPSSWTSDPTGDSCEDALEKFLYSKPLEFYDAEEEIVPYVVCDYFHSITRELDDNSCFSFYTEHEAQFEGRDPPCPSFCSTTYCPASIHFNGGSSGDWFSCNKGLVTCLEDTNRYVADTGLESYKNMAECINKISHFDCSSWQKQQALSDLVRSCRNYFSLSDCYALNDQSLDDDDEDGPPIFPTQELPVAIIAVVAGSVGGVLFLICCVFLIVCIVSRNSNRRSVTTIKYQQMPQSAP